MYNKSIVGWNGHSKDGKTLGSTLGGQGKYLDKIYVPSSATLVKIITKLSK